MKAVLIAVCSLAFAICGCGMQKEIQVELVKAELVKIETITRFSKYVKRLTWEDQDQIRYISYVPIDKSPVLGMQVIMMRHR